MKSIVNIEFTRCRPKTFWNDGSNQYGFWANPNPNFDHPRWSQATEVFLNTFGQIPTPMYNGYEPDDTLLYDENKGECFH